MHAHWRHHCGVGHLLWVESFAGLPLGLLCSLQQLPGFEGCQAHSLLQELLKTAARCCCDLQ